MDSKFHSLVITSEAVYYEGKQVGRIKSPNDMPRYTNYLLTPLPESGGVQSFDWIVPSWLTRLRYDLYAHAAERETGEDWETQFDREFYEGVYGCAESDGEYYPLEEKMKQFIRGLLERSK